MKRQDHRPQPYGNIEGIATLSRDPLVIHAARPMTRNVQKIAPTAKKGKH